MSININRQAQTQNLAVEQNKAQQKKTVDGQQSAAPASSKDSVQLTSQAVTLNKMQQTPSEQQVNKQRVETLKAAILNGAYKVNTERLAEKLSKFEGDFSKAFV